MPQQPYPMRDFAEVTENDLAQARQDPAFRHQLVAENLEFLLDKLNRLRELGNSAENQRDLKEGIALAVKLADLLQKLPAPASLR